MTGLLGIFLNTLLPVFALVALGSVVAKPLELQARTLSRVAYYLFIPAFVFQTLSTARIDLGVAARVTVYTLAVHLAVALLGFVVARVLRRSSGVVAAYVLIAVFGNVGNFGLPIVQFDLGREALPIGTVYFLVILTVSFVVGVAAANWRHGIGTTALLNVLKTPALLALPPAILVNTLSIPVPLSVSRGVQLLADAMIPVMLVALGVQMARTGLPRFTVDTTVSSIVRLIGGAALAFALAPLFGVNGIERSVGILQAAMPTAVLASIIALENNLEPELVMGAVIQSTLLALPVLTVVLALV
jgi:malate permease and related proteins